MPNHSLGGSSSMLRGGKIHKALFVTGGPLLFFGVTIASNLLGGVILARAMTVPDRGVVVLLATACSVIVIWTSFGLPEYQQRSVRLLRPTTSMVASSQLLILLASTIVFVLCGQDVNDIATLAAYLGYATVANANTMLIVWCQLLRGLNRSLLIQASHASVTATVTALVYATTGQMRVLTVVSIWLLAELLTAFFLSFHIWSGVRDVSNRPDRADLRRSLQHSMAQSGALMGDRGLVFLAGAVGGTSSAATMAVAQSTTSPYSLIVSAFTPKLLLGGPAMGRTIHWIAGSTLAMGLVLLPATPALMRWIFGDQYESLASAGFVVGLSGILMALWRLAALRLRAGGTPAKALMADVVAFCGAVLCAAMLILDGMEEQTGPAWLLLSYGALGSLVVTLLVTWPRLRARNSLGGDRRHAAIADV